MNELPSTSSGSKDEEYPSASTMRAIMRLAENAERQRLKELEEEQAELGRYLEQRIREREREIRLQNKRNRDGPRPPVQDIPMHDPYDSSESGYCSIKGRRPKCKSEQMWDKIRNRKRRLLEEKERQKEEEDKRELDAMFHVLLHDDSEDLFSEGEYEFKFPEFMNFDEIKRGFDEQMKQENAMRKKREEAERKAAASKEETMMQEDVKPSTPKYKNQWGHAVTGYNFPPINTDWSLESNATMKMEQQPHQNDNKVIEVYASSDEEDNSTNSITKKAMKWTISSSGASTSAGTSGNSNCTATSTAIITVHDSDSE